jgi:hypothetical protein
LKKLTYGSDGYKEALERLQIALKHHYKNNRHHPEYFENGIDDMNLFDIVELLFDWKAATERHEDGDIYKSFEINEKRFNIPPGLIKMFKNTAEYLGWETIEEKKRVNFEREREKRGWNRFFKEGSKVILDEEWMTEHEKECFKELIGRVGTVIECKNELNCIHGAYYVHEISWDTTPPQITGWSEESNRFAFAIASTEILEEL